MGFRFRRSVRLFPGVRLNASRSGLSMSVGTRGAWYTVGPRGRRRATVGLPGTGISYTQTSRVQHGPPRGLTPEEARAEYRRSVIRGRFYCALIVIAVVWYVWSVAVGR
jgi:Protein of unknown function (DUF4236)